MKELRRTFRPEFINRIDEIIIFNSLSKDVVYAILDNIIKEIEERLADKKLKISLSEAAKKFIIDESFDPDFGARPIKRYVARNLETMLAKAIVNDEVKFNSEIKIDVYQNELVIK